MGQALYRKYRSKSLDEIVGQEHITETLRRAIASGKISHAYLFTGPRGVGKTSIARILAHELNGVQYSGEDNHLDIIEIDAASNGGVEEVRDLRDKVYIAPSSGKFKVYIIDEVHMMTTSAFNALLKTLEEPPAHAVFILATTEAHKLPATIISRTQRFTFKPIAREKMVAHLKDIAKTEKIDVADEALDLIAEHSDGSFRDSISMLDQAGSSGQKVDRETVEKLLGIPTGAVTGQLIACLQQGDAAGLATLLASLRADGYQAAAIAKQLAQDLRSQLLAGSPPLAPAAVLSLLARLIEVPAAHNADQMLEIALLEACLAVVPAAVAPAVSPPPQGPAVQVIVPVVQAPAERSAPAKPAAAAAAPMRPKPATIEEAADEPEPSGNFTVDTQVWQALLESLKKQYNTLYGIIRMARPEFEPGKVTLTFGFAFHQKRANDPKNKKIITSTLEEITGQKVSITCKYDKDATPLVTPPAEISSSPASPALGAISNIFGGGEVIKP